MKGAKVVNLSPNKSNIKLCVSKLDRNEELDKTLAPLIEDLKSKGREMKKTIIYCRSITACGDIFEVLLENLPANELYGMFHSKTPESIKKNILCEFVKRDSKMRLVVATCALGMGVDIPDVELIIHYGIPTEVESYVQEIGRGGRDGRACDALLYYKPYHLAHCDKEMREYVKATNCRRKELLKHFKEKEAALDVMHKCCDSCTQLCKCQGDNCVMQLEAEENVDIRLPGESLSRTVENEEREQFIELLTDIDKLGTYETLGSDLILEIAGKLEYIFFADFLIGNFPIFNLHLANDIILALKDIFNDISEASAYVAMDFEPYFEDDPLLLGAAYCSDISDSSSDDDGNLQ